jgi:multiple sugar transport system substrate-binding protein
MAGKLAEIQAIQPLENWLDKSPIKAEIAPALFESMELDGHTWSIPLATNNTAIFYRLTSNRDKVKLIKTWSAKPQFCEYF